MMNDSLSGKINNGINNVLFVAKTKHFISPSKWMKTTQTSENNYNVAR